MCVAFTHCSHALLRLVSASGSRMSRDKCQQLWIEHAASALFSFLTDRQNWSHLLSLKISHWSYIFTSCVLRTVASQCRFFPFHCFMKMMSVLHWTSLIVTYIKEPLCFSMPFLSAHLFFGHIFRKEILIASLCRKPSFQARLRERRQTD